VVTYPDLLHLADEESYRQHYESLYCASRFPLRTIDGIPVSFGRDKFGHAFRESLEQRDKSVFSWERAKRMEWIGVALRDPDAVLTTSWNRDTRQYDQTRRNCRVQNNYIVVLRTTDDWGTAKFVTAFLASGNAYRKICGGPVWKKAGR